jgi:hypothetical protein
LAIDNPAGWLQNAGVTHTAEQLRTYTGANLNGLGAAGAVTRTRGGVNPALGTAMVVTQNGTPNMSVNVGAGVAFIEGSESANQGVYAVRAGTVTNLTITTAPGAGNSRIDLVVAKVQDSAYSGATDAWSLAVVTGTASASPSPPTAPNNSLVLGQILVGASVTSIVTGNITDRRFFAAASGGNTPCLSTSRPTNLYDGLGIFEYDTNLYSWTDGANWFPQSQWVQGQNIWYLPTGGNPFTSTSYINILLDGVNRTITLTKRYASSRIIVRYAGTGWHSANALTTIGVNINGTDYDIRRCFSNTATAGAHLDMQGERWFTSGTLGISTGSLTFQMRVKTASGTLNMDASDTFSFTVEEVQ